MIASVALMEEHLEQPRAPFAGGKVVLARLAPGRSMIGSAAPSVKMVLEGEQSYEVGACLNVARLDAAKPSTRRDILQRLERARTHLHDHLDRNVALAELASVARLSQFHLARYFKRAFGEAPVGYHRALRLQRAANFLAAGKGSVSQAAELIGYSDSVALSHAFRKYFGVPPQRYAMAARGND